MGKCITSNHLKLKHISISQIINHNMLRKKTTITNKFIYLGFERYIGEISYN